MANLELTSLSCTNCGASLNDFQGKNEVICEYCNTNVRVLRPRQVTTEQGNLSTDNFEKLNNYVEILQKAIRAGNYTEGYEYCNKALEINPNIGAIWENKAICAFWRSVSIINEDKITASNAREIRTFLNASKENDPNSDSYTSTADAIGGNLSIILKLKISLIKPDKQVSVGKNISWVFSQAQLSIVKDYLDTLETAYEIMVNKDLEILKYMVDEFSNHGSILWWQLKNPLGSTSNPTNLIPTEACTNANIDVQKRREVLIKKIKNVEPEYTPPSIKVKGVNIGLIIAIVIAFLAFIIIAGR